LIETENLTKKFGDMTAVEDLTLRVDDGEVFGFLGPNGAGKTTTVRMLTCLISKTSGSAHIDDLDVGKQSDAYQIRKMIGLLPESVGMYDDLSAYKNLNFYGKLYGCAESQRAERIERFLRLLGLWDKRDMPVGTFSKGMRQKVGIARALIHDPKMVFLDEPTANLDPESSRTIREFILELKRDGKTVFLNTHNLDEAQKVCDRVGILKGRLLAAGRIDDLRSSLFPIKTVIQLELLSEPVIAAVKRLGPKSFGASGNELIVEVSDTVKENPEIVKAIVAAGGRIVYVNDLSPTLEDVYLRLVMN
jgi:ABC-2 type transport system ATP-binding protein